MEGLVAAYKGKKVLVTGHSGFKGSWLSLWLNELGAQICGLSKDIPTQPSNFKLAAVEALGRNVWADINDRSAMKTIVDEFKPEIVFHLAAQPIVIDSYRDPIDTFSTNVMGTANVLDAIRGCDSVKAVVAITTDKVYANIEQDYAYTESDKLGGYDPYSASKAAAEIVIASYRCSFFNNETYGKDHHTLVASARAGNVIGGGDFAPYRLVPDCIRSFMAGENVVVRNPGYVRPWQHVLEPLYGYLLLGRGLMQGRVELAKAWNFGPDRLDAKNVASIVDLLVRAWGGPIGFELENTTSLHEAKLLMLDNTQAARELGWTPVWHVADAINRIVEWSQVYNNKGNVRDMCIKQIRDYSEEVRKNG